MEAGMKTKRKSLFIALCVLAALGAGAALMSRNRQVEHAAEAQAAPRAALTVSVETPQLRELPLVLSANGNIAAWQEAIIGSEAGGLKLTAEIGRAHV